MIKLSLKTFGHSSVMSNFPGPSNQVPFAGRPAYDCLVSGGFGVGNIGIGFGSMSYNGNLALSIGIDESIIPCSEMNMDVFISNIFKELDVLKHGNIV